MKRILRFIMIGILLHSLTSCEKIKGRGESGEEIRNLDPFSALVLSLDCEVKLFLISPDTAAYDRSDQPEQSSGKAYQITIIAQENIREIIQTTVAGGALRIDLEKNKLLKDHERIIIEVYVPDIQNITMNTPGTITVKSADSVLRSMLECNLLSSGTLNLRTTAYRYLKITNTGPGYVFSDGVGWIGKGNIFNLGPGTIDLLKIPADSVCISSSGSGPVLINSLKFLDATILGSGNIYFLGTPETIKSNITGTGSLIRL